MTLRWGILATGNIARSMAEALALAPDADRHAVASRDLQKARDFAGTYGFSKAYGSYEAVLSDPDVDVVYIATPNAMHRDNILACLDAGKHVLCEKPMTTSAADTVLCVEAARQKGLFLMEAVWTRFLPAMASVKAALAEGRIGDPFLYRASFVAHRDPVQFPNLFNKALGGGALLDLGVYPLTVGQYLMGDILSAEAVTRFGETGVDVLSALTVRFENHAIGQLACGFIGDVPATAEIHGSNGTIRIPEPFSHPSAFEIVSRGGQIERVDAPPIGKGYAHEVVEVHRCLAEGRTESPDMPLDQSIATAQILEDLLNADT